MIPGNTRTERDLLGEKEVPADAYFGVQTARALENFQITGVPISLYPDFISSFALVKIAAAQANRDCGVISDAACDGIVAASREIAQGKLLEQFSVDVIQGGAGTSTNMNTNEVIANIALTHLNEPLGNYTVIHPNNDVNMSQSTNDAYPTAVRLSILLSHGELVEALQSLIVAFSKKTT